MSSLCSFQVSGGEDGARYGPSLMPGGHVEGWLHIKPIFQVGYDSCVIFCYSFRYFNFRFLTAGNLR